MNDIPHKMKDIVGHQGRKVVNKENTPPDPSNNKHDVVEQKSIFPAVYWKTIRMTLIFQYVI